MEIIADILMASGAIGAGVYCFVLGRRLNRFNDLEKGVGGAVAVLSAQVDDLSKTLEAAQRTASNSAETLTNLTSRAEDIPAITPAPIEEASPVAAPESSRPSTPLFARRVQATSGDAA